VELHLHELLSPPDQTEQPVSRTGSFNSNDRNFVVTKIKSPTSQPCDSTNVTELSRSVRGGGGGIRTKKIENVEENECNLQLTDKKNFKLSKS
jgi:hypothetical protein